jgi:Arc/MetJ family transcription regulator
MMIVLVRVGGMRTTITLDDADVEIAKELTQIRETSRLVKEAITALIERESARRLARLGGSAPNATSGRRRRPAA